MKIASPRSITRLLPFAFGIGFVLAVQAQPTITLEKGKLAPLPDLSKPNTPPQKNDIAVSNRSRLTDVVRLRLGGSHWGNPDKSWMVWALFGIPQGKTEGGIRLSMRSESKAVDYDIESPSFFQREKVSNELFRLKSAGTDFCLATGPAESGHPTLRSLILKACGNGAEQLWALQGTLLMNAWNASTENASLTAINTYTMGNAHCLQKAPASHKDIFVAGQCRGIYGENPANLTVTLVAFPDFSLKSAYAPLHQFPVWSQLAGTAVDVGAGGTALWVLGTNPAPGGFGLHRWDGKTFVPESGGAVRIDVDPQGNPWVVNDKDDILRWTGSSWVQLPGKAKDIGVGANGAAWVVGANKVPGGYGIYRWNGSTWIGMPGGAVRIDVDPSGNAWIVNDANNIFRWTGSSWEMLAGKARDIGIGPEGSVFVVGDNGTVHKWDGKTWIMRDGILNEITVGPGGVPVGINAGKQIWLGYP